MLSPAWASALGGAWWEEQVGAGKRKGSLDPGPWDQLMSSLAWVISLWKVHPGLPSPPNPAPELRLPGPAFHHLHGLATAPTAAHLGWCLLSVHRNREGWAGHGDRRLQEMGP